MVLSMSQERIKLDFFVVAAARGGTSWLHACLADHPQICLAAKKEFSPFDDAGRFLVEETAAQFTECHNPAALRGTMPVYYSARPETSTWIKREFPDSKIIMFLRNPIERAYSQYRHNVTRGVLADVSFSEAIREHKVPLEYGFYADAVEAYWKDFGRGGVFVVLHNEMMRDHAGTLAAVQRFLGIDVRESPYTETFISVSRMGRKNYNSELLFRVHRAVLALGRAGKRAGGAPVAWLVRHLHLAAIPLAMGRMNYNEQVDRGPEDSMEAITMASVDRAFLQDYYANDIAKLSRLLGRELAWS